MYFSQVNYIVILNLSLLTVFIISNAHQEDDKIEEFIATNEWQEVKEGQAIPPGLHVKMDLSNGGRWAKLMEEEETNNNALLKTSVGDKSEIENVKSKLQDIPSYNADELKAALKKMKFDKFEKESDKDIKSKFRSMDEIREAFDQFDLHQESDIDVMKRLIGIVANESAPIDNKLLALQDLEYYVHQIDNANDLITFGGFAVIVRTLNSSDVYLKEESAHVIGSAVQSNPKVQIEALRSHVLRTLLLILSGQFQPLGLRKKCMYAISSLIRNFPLAQTHFVQYGGLEIMLQLFSQHDADSLQIKAIHLLNDIVEERLSTAKDFDDPQQQEKLKQYSKVNIGLLANQLGWCKVISSCLNRQQHTWRESVMSAMKTLYQFCKHDFRNITIVNTLNNIQIEYKQLADQDASNGENDSYYSSLYQLSHELLNLTSSRKKDEF